MQKCRYCGGSGKLVTNHVRYANGTSGYDVPLACFRCDGSGNDPDQTGEWLEKGHRLRRLRIGGKKYHSIMEASSLYGCAGVEWSKAESASIDPSVFLEWAEKNLGV